MKNYIGIKKVKAMPLTRKQYDAFRFGEPVKNENDDDEGYLVEYQDSSNPNTSVFKGYVSWSPKEVFEKSYMDCDDTSIANDNFAKAVLKLVEMIKPSSDI